MPPTFKQRAGRWLIPRLPFNPELFQVLRFEMNAFVWRARNQLSPAYHRKLRRLRREKGISLNVGSGGRGLDGWVNTDAIGHAADQVMTCDIRRSIPLSEASVSRIMAEHVIEHLNFRHDLPKVLLEFHRILEPGGSLRIVVPDGRRFAEAYVRRDPASWVALGIDPFPADMPTPMAMLNHVFHQAGEHHFAFDFESLEWALTNAGFVSITKCSFGVSRDPRLAIDRAEHAKYSLYVEGMKP